MVLSRTTAGATVTGTARVNQQFDVILSTPKGSILGDPNKGIREDIQDLPVTEVVPALVEDLNIQTTLYMPDVRVDRILSDVQEDGLLVTIKWSYKNGAGGGELRRII